MVVTSHTTVVDVQACIENHLVITGLLLIGGMQEAVDRGVLSVSLTVEELPLTEVSLSKEKDRCKIFRLFKPTRIKTLNLLI